MISQILLISAFLFISIWLMTSRNKAFLKAGQRIALVIFLLFSIVAIIWPNLLTRIAKDVGIGRGADLLLYIFVLVFVAYALQMYLKYKEEQRRFVKLARRMAIIEANLNKHNKKK